MKGIATCKDCLLELWKTNCEDCEDAKPIVRDLEREGYKFEKYDIRNDIGRSIWDDYVEEIDENSRRLGYQEGYIYTPTFINPKTREVLSFSDRSPTKAELIKLAKGGEKNVD